MKFVIIYAFVLFAATVTCYPASTDKLEDGAVEVFRPTYSSGRRYGQGVIDVDANQDDDDDVSFFRGFNFQDLFDDLNKQMQEVQRQYAKSFKDLLDKGNTTSTVEVIDGHKVIKNETVYKDPNSFVKSVVIHVVPNGDGSSTEQSEHTNIDHVTTRTRSKARPSENTPEPDTEPIERKRDREPLGESVENEVDDRSEVNHFNIETLDGNEIPSLDKFKYEIDDGWKSPYETRPEIPYDLSNDIAVNDDQGLPINPDAEYVELGDLMPPKLV